MATGPVANQGKGKFLRRFLASNRDAKVEDVAAAWQTEGHDDGISESMVNKIRSELGLVKRRGSISVSTGDAGSKKAKSSPKVSKGKGKATKSKASPLSPDAREGTKRPSKTSFVEELLGREPGANLNQVNKAWASSGQEGEISPTSFYNVKKALGGTGETSLSTSKSSPKTKKAASIPDAASSPVHREAASSSPTPTTAEQADVHGRELHEIEGEIDELMFRLKGLGSFAEVQEALRTARRLLVRSHEH